MRRKSDVDVGTGGRTCDGLAKCNEGDSGVAKISDQGLAFDAVRVHSDVDRFVMVESEAVVYRCLAHGADRKLMAEPPDKKAFNPGDVRDHPAAGTNVADQRCSCEVST